MRPTGTREGRSLNALAVLLTASAGCAMTVLDTNVVAVVLPTIARDLGASFADVEWVVSTYVLCFATLLLPAGSIADRFGRRKVFLGGIGLFALASLLCGAAPSAPALYLARGAQGVGAAFLLAPALAIIGHAFHDEAERARAWAIWGGNMGLTMVLAPIIGGVIAYGLGWRWAFYVNVPVCALLGTAVLPLIQESRDSEARSLDPAGIILFAVSMFGLTWGLIHGQAQGWLSTSALAALPAASLHSSGFWRLRPTRLGRCSTSRSFGCPASSAPCLPCSLMRPRRRSWHSSCRSTCRTVSGCRRLMRAWPCSPSRSPC